MGDFNEIPGCRPPTQPSKGTFQLWFDTKIINSFDIIRLMASWKIRDFPAR